MPEAPSRRLERAAVAAALLLCSAYLAWVVPATRGARLATDSVHNAILARNLARGDGYAIHVVQYHVGSFDFPLHVPDMHGILQPLAVAGLFALAGPGEDLARLPALLGVAGCGLLAFLFGRHLFGSLAGLLACSLVLTSSLLFEWARYATDDAGYACAFLATVYLGTLALSEERPRLFLATGLAAGVALLQKPSGVVLLAVLPVALLASRPPGTARARRLAALMIPTVLAYGAYMARNLFAHGDIGFRWGATAWVYKSQGIEAFYRVYAEAPGLWETLDALGWAEVARIVVVQVGEFGRAAFSLDPLWGTGGARLTDPGLVSGVGLFALLLHRRHQRHFVRLTALSLLVSVALVCVISHLELRYFAMLVPLLCISFAGGLVWLAGRRFGPAWLPAGLAVLLGLASVASAASTLSWYASAVGRGGDPCPAASAWILRETTPDEAVLDLDPWRQTWYTDRPSLVIPSGGSGSVIEVVRRYRPGLVVLRRGSGRRETVDAIHKMVSQPQPGFEAALAFDGSICDVYRLGG